MRGLVLAAAAVSMLAGCAELEERTRPAPRTVTEAAPAPVASYCYQTLGRVDCYRAPRPGDSLVGVDIQPPR